MAGKEKRVHKKEMDQTDMLQDRTYHNFVQVREEFLKKAFLPFESKIMYFQGLLVWEIPHYSAVLFLGIHLLFWFATYMRIYYLIGMTGFCMCSWKLWTHHIWPEIRVPFPIGYDPEDWTPVYPRLMSVPELCHHAACLTVRVELCCQAAYQLRQHNPAKFFLYAMTVFSLLGVVGHYIKGIYILYATVMGTLLMPSVFYHDLATQVHDTVSPIVQQVEGSMNIKRKRSVKRKKDGQYKMADYSDTDDEEMKDFVPQITDTQASLLSLRTQQSEDERLTPSLLPAHMPDCQHSDNDSTLGDMPSQIPSIMDDSETDFRFAFKSYDHNSSNNNRSDETPEADVTLHEEDSAILEHDMQGTLFNKKHEDLIQAENSPTTQAKKKSSNKSLEFDPEYFKRDSSGEDDDHHSESHMAHGLDFPDFDATTSGEENHANAGALGILSNITQGGSQQMGAILAGALSNAQESVSNIAATHMVTSLMQNTMSNLLGGANSGEQKFMVEGQLSNESEEFEFLDKEDLDNFDEGKA